MENTQEVQQVMLYELQKVDKPMPFEAVQIKSSSDAYMFIRQFYGSDLGIYESFFVLMLNRKNVTIGYAKISQGGVSGTVVDTKIIAKYVADSLANSIIIAHNHPSGNTEPSASDHEITTKVIEMLKYLDSKLLDHIILTEKGYYSFADSGKV